MSIQDVKVSSETWSNEVLALEEHQIPTVIITDAGQKLKGLLRIESPHWLTVLPEEEDGIERCVRCSHVKYIRAAHLS